MDFNEIEFSVRITIWYIPFAKVARLTSKFLAGLIVLLKTMSPLASINEYPEISSSELMFKISLTGFGKIEMLIEFSAKLASKF